MSVVLRCELSVLVLPPPTKPVYQFHQIPTRPVDAVMVGIPHSHPQANGKGHQ
jgi:hypothetical protein